MKNSTTITPATAFGMPVLAPMAVPAYGRGVSALMRKRNAVVQDQDATNGFHAWSPPV